MENYQIGVDDLILQERVGSQLSRTAFIDEYGSFGFDFSSPGNTKYYVLCAVIVSDDDIDAMHESMKEIKKKNRFENAELKSSTIGKKYGWRNKILYDLLMIKFGVILLIADKQAFIKGLPLTNYKKPFIKYLHKLLYGVLYQTYPKLKIIEDATGTTEFQESFRNYVSENRPKYNLLNDYDFDYVDSKDELLIQLADIICGSIGHSLSDSNSPNYREMLKSKILCEVHFPNAAEPYWGTTNPENYKYNKDIYTLAVKCANDFILNTAETDNEEYRAQIAFLRHLLFQVNINPTYYISANAIIDILQEYLSKRIAKTYLYRRIIAPLRDKGVIIASCPRGYKIPISVQDITTYLNQTHNVVSPMLHRVEICRSLIMRATTGNLDILDDPAFVRYKRYFD